MVQAYNMLPDDVEKFEPQVKVGVLIGVSKYDNYNLQCNHAEREMEKMQKYYNSIGI